jgi:hypothetical protein
LLAVSLLAEEYVPVVTSVTTLRPGRWDTRLGSFEYHHIKTEMLHSARLLPLSNDQQAFVATPEKALLDLVHLWPGGDSPAYLLELRLQYLNILNLDEM